MKNAQKIFADKHQKREDFGDLCVHVNSIAISS
jgi:hypothetical protein